MKKACSVRKVLYVIEPKSGIFKLGLKEIIEFKELLYFFAWRDIKVRYKQTVLGFSWVMLQPLALMAIMVFIFGTKFKMNAGAIEYPVFVLSGLILWNAFSSSVNNASSSMISQANIIKKIYFPKILIPLAGIFVALFDLIITLLLFFIVMIIYKEEINFLNLLWCLPAAIGLQLLASSGVALWASALTVKFRDFKFIIPITLQLLMFASPVIFPLSIFGEEWIRILFSINPMVAPIEVFRMLIQDASIETLPVLVSIGTSFILFITGLIFFRNTEKIIADVI